MKKINVVLKRKGFDFYHVTPNTSVIEALQLMAEKNIGSVLVLEEMVYQGILTERDYARKVILKGKKSSDIVVKEIMGTDAPKITQETSVEEAIQLMGEKNIRYLPVFENNKICGIISISDLVKEVILTQEEAISQLRDYMTSNS